MSIEKVGGSVSSVAETVEAEFGSLQPQEVVLGWCGEYMQPEDLAWSGGLVMLMRELGFSEGASRIALSRIVSRDLLRRARTGRRIFYAVSPRLTKLLEEGRRQTYFFREQLAWDGLWTLVWYSIPDSLRPERRRLSRRLSFLGFGALQDGTWIIPRDHSAELAGSISELGLTGYVSIICGYEPTGVDMSTALRTAWDLEGLDVRYRSFVEKFEPFTATLDSLSDAQSFSLRTSAIDAFRQLAVLDPKIAVPACETGDRQGAIELFARLADGLFPAANAHFGRLTERGT